MSTTWRFNFLSRSLNVGSLSKTCAWASIGSRAVNSCSSWLEKLPLTALAAFAVDDSAGVAFCACLSQAANPNTRRNERTNVFMHHSHESLDRYAICRKLEREKADSTKPVKEYIRRACLPGTAFRKA